MENQDKTSVTPASGISIKKIQESGADDKVVEVYRLLKRYKEDTDRQDWEKQVYKRGWEVAWGKKDASVVRRRKEPDD